MKERKRQKNSASFRWYSRYPYDRNSYAWFIYILAAILLVAFLGLSYADTAFRYWIGVAVILILLWMTLKNIIRLYHNEEISIENDTFIITHNKKIIKEIKISDIFVYESSFWWRWKGEKVRRFVDINTKKSFYEYETNYLTFEDEKILSSIIKVGNNT